MSLSRSQNGFSLVEVLVASVLLGIIAMGVINYVSVNRSFSDKVQGKSSCTNEAMQILSNFKNKGLIRNQISLDIGPGGLGTANILPPSNAETTELGLAFPDRWNANMTPVRLLGAGTTPLLYPASLYMGTMTTLEALYKLNSAFCTGKGISSSGAIPSLLSADGLFKNISATEAQQKGLPGAVAFLKIQAFNTNAASNATIGCGTPTSIVPPPGGTNALNGLVPVGLRSSGNLYEQNYPAAPSSALSTGDKIGNLYENRGWEVTVRIEYQSSNNPNAFCEVSERFQYPAISPPTNNLTVANSESLNTSVTSGGGSHQRTCGGSPLGNINIQLNNAKRGGIFLCRNFSRQRVAVDANLIAGKTIASPEQSIRFSGGLGYGRPSGARRQSFFSTEITNTDPDDFVLGAQYPARGIGEDPTTNTATGSYYCNIGDGCYSLPFFQSDLNNTPPIPSAAPEEGQFYPSDHQDDTNIGVWQPCARTSIQCATSPSNNATATYPPVFADYTNATTYQLQYTGLPPGCEVHIQMAEVDAAYNVRATEVREYIYEPLPGDRLCWNGAGLGGRAANRWYFSCRASGGPMNAWGNCGLRTTRNPAASQPAIFYVEGTSCCIDFPGTTGIDNDFRAGTWINGYPATTRPP